MTRLRVAVLVLVVFASLAVAAVMPLQALPSMGQHRVLPGETLYCIGRGYGVAPWAIAQANGLSVLARLSVGQMLSIPAVAWVNIPPGPTCAPQFAASGQATAPVTPTTCASTGTGTSVTYRVLRGDTLWRIATRNRITVAALKQANNLRSNIIYVGQQLIIPGAALSAACPTSAAGNQAASTAGPSNPGNPSEPTATSFVPPAPTNTLAPEPTNTLPPTATDPAVPSATPTNTPIGPSATPAGPTNTPTNTPAVPTNTPPGGYPPPVTNTPPGYPS